MAIKEVYQFANGMVMVFDEKGQQMSEFQGRVEEVRDKIKVAASHVVWKFGTWKSPSDRGA